MLFRSVYSSLKETDPRLSLGTVYRNLGLLVELGQIRRISAGHGPDRYDGNTACHAHFICRNCGRIMDLPSREADEQLRAVLQKSGRCADHIQITAGGLCEYCLPAGSVPKAQNL